MLSNSTAVASQSGIVGGSNPTVYDSKNPILVFIIQAGIIIIFCRLLHWPLSKIRQPRVIAEVIGGILLGPSVFGRIPGFTDTIFPSASIPTLNATANLGNWRIAASVSAAGMALPFGLGCAVSYGLYNQFRNDPGIVYVEFGTYLLFVGIAMAITAFPVLCRILTELKLLNTNVGVIVLSAGVGNDVTGWILLALCVALVNAGSGITALWVLVVAVGYIFFLSFLVRPVFMWYLRKTGSLEKGPSQSVVTVTLLLALASAFFTQAIGIHAIFGGFIVGLICPHEGGFAIKLTEKIEDLVAAIFLPLYFALSGLQTNLGLLDSGIVWGYVVGIIAIAFFAKVVGGTFASRLTGLLWRESFTVGVLMSCKGLVELIVLNIGLQAKILSDRTFTMFVVMALVVTFLTTPLTSLLYPKWYQDKVARWRRGEIDWDGNVLSRRNDRDDSSVLLEKLRARPIERIAVYLRLDSLASVCNFVGLLGTRGKLQDNAPRAHYSKRTTPVRSESSAESQADNLEPEESTLLHAHGIRLMELTDRISSTMQVSEIQEYSIWDPVVNVFRSFGQINSIPSEGRVSVVPESSYADVVADMARDTSSDLLLVPWSASGSMSDRQSVWTVEDSSTRANASYPTFVYDILNRSSIGNVGVLVDRALKIPNKEHPKLERSTSSRTVPNIRTNLASLTTRKREQHILLIYIGGADDRFALRLVLQLAQNEDVTATIVHIDASSLKGVSVPETTEASSSAVPSLAATDKESDAIFFASLRESLPAELSSRVVFRNESLTNNASTVVGLAVAIAQDEASKAHSEPNQMVVVGRRSVGGEPFSADPSGEPDTQKALGAVGDALVRKGVKSSVLVLQGAAQ
ncbi:K(+)/H(+) antiporter 1 [Talaromyces islandicus]|uniref:K(+)/H(+) antiporter 1 n=1 Tax=Talaromyces islandicus TaxID=28573 RepID=A0A0U1M7W8_TALIS|nr:K(+)/H(+) antiporter 1 [Talaromyces islandicus]